LKRERDALAKKEQEEEERKRKEELAKRMYSPLLFLTFFC
jgi:hypothetical protein